MKSAERKTLHGKPSQSGSKNGHKAKADTKFYAPGERMSKADRTTLKAWKKTYENREFYLELIKS